MPKTDRTNAKRQQRWRDRQKAKRLAEQAERPEPVARAYGGELRVLRADGPGSVYARVEGGEIKIGHMGAGQSRKDVFWDKPGDQVIEAYIQSRLHMMSISSAEHRQRMSEWFRLADPVSLDELIGILSRLYAEALELDKRSPAQQGCYVTPQLEIDATEVAVTPQMAMAEALDLSASDARRQLFITNLPVPGPEWRIWLAKGYATAADYARAERTTVTDRDAGICYDGRRMVSYPAIIFPAVTS